MVGAGVVVVAVGWIGEKGAVEVGLVVAGRAVVVVVIVVVVAVGWKGMVMTGS